MNRTLSRRARVLRIRSLKILMYLLHISVLQNQFEKLSFEASQSIRWLYLRLEEDLCIYKSLQSANTFWLSFGFDVAHPLTLEVYYFDIYHVLLITVSSIDFFLLSFQFFLSPFCFIRMLSLLPLLQKEMF